MNVLITGGFGYLGGTLAKLLVSKSGNQILLGSRSKGEPPKWLSQARVVQTKWESLASLENCCGDMDAIIHLAGMNSQDCINDPVSAFQHNAVSTALLVQAAIRRGVKRFIYLSTAHVYGSSLTGVVTEDSCSDSFNPYAASHRAGEDVVRDASQKGDIQGIVIRLSNSYGAPADKNTNCWSLLVNDLCRQAVITNHLSLRSSGLQRRNLIPLPDACRAIEHLLYLPEEYLDNIIFNVGGDWTPTVLEVAHLVRERCIEILGIQPKLTHLQPQTDEFSNDFDYRFDILRGTGFRLASNKTLEIDRLINFCKTSFL